MKAILKAADEESSTLKVFASVNSKVMAVYEARNVIYISIGASCIIALIYLRLLSCYAA